MLCCVVGSSINPGAFMDVTPAGRRVGPDHPRYIIAEIGSNHHGDVALAKRMIDVAKRCGADAVKFQSWRSTSLVAEGGYDRNTEDAFGSPQAMVEAYRLPPPQRDELAAYGAEVGIHFLASAFSVEEVAPPSRSRRSCARSTGPTPRTTRPTTTWRC